MRREWALFLSRKAPVFVEGDHDVTSYPDRFAECTLGAAEHLRSLGMAVFFGEFCKRDTAHSGVLKVLAHH